MTILEALDALDGNGIVITEDWATITATLARIGIDHEADLPEAEAA